MVNDLYSLDLQTLEWERIWPKNDEEAQAGPQPRYFHSADADIKNQRLLIFGGMGQTAEAQEQQQQQGQKAQESQPTSADSANDTGLAVLSDLLIYDTLAGKWSTPQTTTRPGVEPPLARYAHLSAISNGCLVILGGQDILNRYIEQLSCLDLETMTYVQNSEWKGHAGTYRSVATSRQLSVKHAEGASSAPSLGAQANGGAAGRDRAYSSATYDSAATDSTASQLDEKLQLPFTVLAHEQEPVYTFTNMNFAEVRRLFDIIPAPNKKAGPSPSETGVIPLSDLMVGAPSLPPGLRFPTASMVGSHLILTGTLITQQVSSFAIWTVDLSKASTPKNALERPKLVWQKIDAGGTLKTGSWNRAVAWKNTIVILGDRDRDIAVDYNRRQNNFTHVAFVDLEVRCVDHAEVAEQAEHGVNLLQTFGIYQPPPQVLPLAAQELGLRLLDQPLLADFEIVCADGVRLPCSRQMLEARWPWFSEKMTELQDRIRTGLPDLFEADSSEDVRHAREQSGGTISASGKTSSPRAAVLPSALLFPETSQVALALLQFFYTYNLITPLQHNTSTLVSLLLIGKEYDIPNLRALVVHAFHCLLEKPNGHTMAAIIYEAATLGGCTALQTRALKMMMNVSGHHARAVEPERMGHGLKPGSNAFPAPTAAKCES